MLLGQIYHMHESVRNYEESAKWLRRAVELNHPDAMFALGLMTFEVRWRACRGVWVVWTQWETSLSETSWWVAMRGAAGGIGAVGHGCAAG